MNTIKLKTVKVIMGNTIEYEYDVSEEIKKYFKVENVFQISYFNNLEPLNIEKVPKGVLSVPFVANVLPIVWLTNSKLIVDELDEDFYECLPNLRQGYEEMFPETNFCGKIEVGKLTRAKDNHLGDACAMFYSGGVDSMQTFVTHLNEKPSLISIWGSDIRYNNVKGWQLVHKAIKDVADAYNLPDIVIHSSFREFDNEGTLDADFHQQLQDGWWHGVKHGIGLLGHVAPYAYLTKMNTMYIASTHCPQDGKVRCASNPLTDNNVRFVGCRVVHDGFEYSRQDKIHNIVEYCRKHNNYLQLHVCWESQSGGNCSHCEKCYRTMAGIIAEGEEPRLYGFENVKENIRDMRYYILSKELKNYNLMEHQWSRISKVVRNNEELIKQTGYWRDIQWVGKCDFMHPEHIKIPISYRIKNVKGIRGRLCGLSWYQKLHQIKSKFI